MIMQITLQGKDFFQTAVVLCEETFVFFIGNDIDPAFLAVEVEV